MKRVCCEFKLGSMVLTLKMGAYIKFVNKTTFLGSGNSKIWKWIFQAIAKNEFLHDHYTRSVIIVYIRQ